MKKLFFTLLIALCVALTLPTALLAEEILPTEEGNLPTEEQIPPTEEENLPSQEESFLKEEEKTPEKSDTAPLLTETVMAFFEEYGDTLLSAVGVVLSVLLAFLYKTGFLPLVTRGLSAISETTGKAAGITADFTEKATAALAAMEEKTGAALTRAEETEAAVKSAEALISAMGDALTEAKAERERITLVLAEETALFYELLNSVKLPETQKEVIREKYYRFQAMLEERQ